MSDKTNTSEKTVKEFTPEEVKSLRAKATQFYQEEIGHLKLQEEYEKLVADIEVHKFRKYEAMAKTAQVFAAMPGKNKSDDLLNDMPEPSKPESNV